MASTPRTRALEEWFRANQGYLHGAIYIAEDDISGLHYRASACIESGVTFVSAPHQIAFSYLNALLDDAYPVFREQRQSFPVEAIGFFYLVAQYLDREHSFWKPYLDTLPSPEDNLLQPTFYDDPEDIIWLEGTDVWHTVIARKEVYRRYYEDGIAILQQAGLEVQEYTWHLFLWAATTFSSRSFASRALHPEESKFWTTYKHTPNGKSQPVSLDMSDIPADDLIFPVLFPGLDAANHSNSARVDWTFDSAKFSIFTNDGAQPGAEVFNNYGPKGNGELLIGYGFCIPDNPYDTVALTLKPPPTALQADLKRAKPEFFNQSGSLGVENTTFRIPRPPAELSNPRDIFLHLPEPLLELLVYVIRFERNLPFETVSISHSNIAESRYLPHVARMIAQSLIQKLLQLQSIELPPEPANRRQEQAAIYRQGQLTILQDIIRCLKIFTRGLIWTPLVDDRALPERPCLVRLEDLIELLSSCKQLNNSFMEGIEASAGSDDLTVLRDAGWEEDIWVLLLCYLCLDPTKHHDRFISRVPGGTRNGHGTQGLDDSALEQGQAAMDIVHAAALACPGSVWEDAGWSADFIAAVGGEIVRNDSFNVMCVEADGVERPRMLVYFLSAREGQKESL